MSAPNQKLSMKDRIVSHLPGHKNQDNNANGVPDRLEKSTAATTGHRTLSDKNGDGIPDRLERNGAYGTTAAPLTATPLASGGSVIPGVANTTTTTSVTGNPNGLPIQGNILGNKTVTTTTSTTEPAFVQTQAYPQSGLTDLNRNGIPDQLERQGSFGQTGYTDLNRNGIPDQLERQGSFGQTGYTDLNRNGIPDQLEGQGFGFVGSVVANQTSVVDVREAPALVERIEKPAVVHEVYKTEEVVQIQPVIEREREQLDVYEVVQPMREREVIATEIREAVLPTQTRAVVVEDNSAFLAARSVPTEFSTREVVATRSQVVENAPIVHETIVHKVIEEVQPVIYKEIDRPVLIKETLPIYEKIVEAPRAHHTVLPMRDLGVRTTTTTGFTDLNRDGIPDQLQGGMYQTTGLQSGLTSQGVYTNQGVSGSDLTLKDKLTAKLPGHQFQDNNGNGIPDRMEGRSKDLNRNGIPDQLERNGSFGQTGLVGQQSFGQTGAFSNDLNRNGIPDQLESGYGSGLQSGYGSGLQSTGLQGGLNDRNMNGIPDNLEGGRQHRSLGDLNGNGIPDRMEKAHGLKDLNGNGVDDSLERRMGQTSLNPNTTF